MCSSCSTATSALSELCSRLQHERALRLHTEQRVLQLERQVAQMKHLTAATATMQESSQPCVALLTKSRSLAAGVVGRPQLKELSTELQQVQPKDPNPAYSEVDMQEAGEDVQGPGTPPRTSRTHIEDFPPTPAQWPEAGAAAAVCDASAPGKRSRHVRSAAPVSLALSCQHAPEASAATSKAAPPPPPPTTAWAAGAAPAAAADAVPGTSSGSGSRARATADADAASADALSLPTTRICTSKS